MVYDNTKQINLLEIAEKIFFLFLFEEMHLLHILKKKQGMI